MKIAIIYPPFFHKLFNENLPTVDDEFGLFPHVNFGYVSVAAKEAGSEVKLFDAAAQKTSYEEVLEDVKKYNPDIIAFTAHAVQTFRDMLLWAEKIKKDLDLPVLVGGYEAKIYPKEIMSHHCFDYLCSGEVMNFLGPFLKAFIGEIPFETVPDLYFRKDGELVSTFAGPYIPFKDFPIPDRSIFDNSLYYSHVSTQKNFSIGMTSIGCPYTCSFCCMASTGFDGRTAKQIAEEIKQCYHEYGIEEFDWFDPIMFRDRKRTLELAQEIKNLNLPIIWSTRTRIDSLALKGSKSHLPDIDLIKALADSGCKRVFVGIESGDDEVLKAISKGQKTRGVSHILETVSEQGIRVLGFFMIGNPAETPTSINKTIKLAKSLSLDYAQFSITVIKPHTRLNDEFMKNTIKIDYWKEYILGNVEEMVLPTPWIELTRAELEAHTKRAYISFYFRPKYILKMLLRIRSFGEFFKYSRVAMQILLKPTKLIKTSKQTTYMVIFVRSLFVFLEAIVALLKVNGTRHPVQAYGSTLRACYRLAKEEWVRSIEISRKQK